MDRERREGWIESEFYSFSSSVSSITRVRTRSGQGKKRGEERGWIASEEVVEGEEEWWEDRGDS